MLNTSPAPPVSFRYADDEWERIASTMPLITSEHVLKIYSMADEISGKAYERAVVSQDQISAFISRSIADDRERLQKLAEKLIFGDTVFEETLVSFGGFKGERQKLKKLNAAAKKLQCKLQDWKNVLMLSKTRFLFFGSGEENDGYTFDLLLERLIKRTEFRTGLIAKGKISNASDPRRDRYLAGILNIWIARGGKLKTQVDPSTNVPGGPLITFVAEVSGPVFTSLSRNCLTPVAIREFIRKAAKGHVLFLNQN